MKNNKILLWILRIIPAIILLQTLFFKFTAHPESVALFEKLGVEPWGRIATGIFELIAAILLLIPSKTIWGALLSIGLMLGAIMSHFLVIGIDSAGDGGFLFILAIIVLVTTGLLAILLRQQIPFSYKSQNIH
jgi:putative oxidoreductase